MGKHMSALGPPEEFKRDKSSEETSLWSFMYN